MTALPENDVLNCCFMYLNRRAEVWTDRCIITSSNIIEPDGDSSSGPSPTAGIHQCYNHAAILWWTGILPWSWHDGWRISCLHNPHVPGMHMPFDLFLMLQFRGLALQSSGHKFKVFHQLQAGVLFGQPWVQHLFEFVLNVFGGTNLPSDLLFCFEQSSVNSFGNRFNVKIIYLHLFHRCQQKHMEMLPSISLLTPQVNMVLIIMLPVGFYTCMKDIALLFRFIIKISITERLDCR